MSTNAYLDWFTDAVERVRQGADGLCFSTWLGEEQRDYPNGYGEITQVLESLDTFGYVLKQRQIAGSQEQDPAFPGQIRQGPTIAFNVPFVGITSIEIPFSYNGFEGTYSPPCLFEVVDEPGFYHNHLDFFDCRARSAGGVS